MSGNFIYIQKNSKDGETYNMCKAQVKNICSNNYSILITINEIYHKTERKLQISSDKVHLTLLSTNNTFQIYKSH